MSEWEQGCLRVFVCKDIQRTAKCNPCNLQWELTMTLACMGFREQSVPSYQHCTALKFLLEVIYVEQVSWWEGSFEVLTVLSDQGGSTQILIKHPASRMNSLKIRKNPAFAVQRIKKGQQDLNHNRRCKWKAHSRYTFPKHKNLPPRIWSTGWWNNCAACCPRPFYQHGHADDGLKDRKENAVKWMRKPDQLQL